MACVRLADAERQQLRDAVEGFASEDDQLELLQAVKMLCNVKTPTYRVRQRIDALRKSRFVDLHRDVQQRIKVRTCARLSRFVASSCFELAGEHAAPCLAAGAAW